MKAVATAFSFKRAEIAFFSIGASWAWLCIEAIKLIEKNGRNVVFVLLLNVSGNVIIHEFHFEFSSTRRTVVFHILNLAFEK